MEEVSNKGDYFGVLRRRMHWLIWPPLVVFLIALTVALLLPNLYKSEAIILIEGTQVTEALVPSTITTYADQRIQSISQQVMSRSKILEIVERFDLYPEQRKKISTEALVEKVQACIAISPISAEVKTTRSDRPSMVTIAFKLAFQGKSPAKVQQVTSELASFFLARNLKARQESAKGTTDFLDRQMELARETISKLEQEIATFKKAHLEELPEFMNLNLQKIEKINSDINNITLEIVSLTEQDTTIRNQLSTLDPYAENDARTSRVLTIDEQLKQLELNRALLKSKYSDEHPAVKAQEKEIEILKKSGASSRDLSQKKERLRELEQELAKLSSRYTKEHPLVKRAKAEIEEIKKDMASSAESIANSTESLPVDTGHATNPAYITLKSERDRISVRLRLLEGERKRLAEERELIYGKLKTMPDVEKKYKELLLDYDNARVNFAELQRKVQVARIAEGMEEGQLGEKFTMIEAPFLPQEPFKPNRIAIIFIGLILGIGSGVGAAALKEFGDHSVRRPEEVEKLSGYTVLSVIPNILTPQVRRKRLLKITTAGLLMVTVPTAGLTLFHFMIMDLYIFYDKVAKFLGDRFFLHF